MRWLILLLAVLSVAAPIVSHERWPDNSSWPLGMNVVNVKEFGARGDGVTDDTAEIQAALNAAGVNDNCDAGSGGVVFIPNGDYLVSDTINVPLCVLLKGEHRSTSAIKAAAAFGASKAVVTLCQEDVTRNGHGCALEGITIDANNAADWGVMTTNGQEGSYIKDFVIRQIDIYGIYLKARAGTDPGVHAMAIEDGEIYFGSGAAASGDKGIFLQSNTYGPADTSIRRVTLTTPSLVVGTIAIDLTQSGMLLESIHIEDYEIGINVNSQNAAIIQVHCVSPTTTCVRLTANSQSTVTIVGLRTDAGVTSNLLDQVTGLDIPSVAATTTAFYFQSGITGTKLNTPIGATSTLTCAVGVEGSLFYDTNAGALGTADDGRFCVCDDNALNGYRWRAIGDVAAGAPVDLAGNSTTDCGT